MDFSYYVGKKLATRSTGSFTRFIMRLAIAGVALSLCVMLISVGIVQGFKEEISGKVIGFDGHLQIRNLDLNMSNELRLIPKDQDFLEEVRNEPGITSLTAFCSKAGILSTDTDIEGLLFKGVPGEYDWDFFQRNLVAGNIPVYTDTADSYDILISNHVSDKLQLEVGERLLVYFLHEGKVRRRQMTISGIYKTGLAEFDRTICMAHIRTIQRIYTVDYSMVSGFEARVSDPERLDEIVERVDQQVGIRLRAQGVNRIHSLLFQWLEIVDSNAVIIIVLMLLVAMVNMVTAFLILIIERTRMIGVLKSLGANNWQVVRIFIYKGMGMIIPGMLIGNIIAWVLVKVQQDHGIIRLDEEIYYMSEVPISVGAADFLWLNLGTFLLCTAILLIPGLLVRRVSPVRAIRFD